MPHFKKLTPNLIVSNVERSVAFYCDMLGFERGMTASPTPARSCSPRLTSGPVEIFFNDAGPADEGIPRARSASRSALPATLFIEVRRTSRAAARSALKDSVKIVMPIVTQFYGDDASSRSRILTGT